MRLAYAKVNRARKLSTHQKKMQRRTPATIDGGQVALGVREPWRVRNYTPIPRGEAVLSAQKHQNFIDLLGLVNRDQTYRGIKFLLVFIFVVASLLQFFVTRFLNLGGCWDYFTFPLSPFRKLLCHCFSPIVKHVI